MKKKILKILLYSVLIFVFGALCFNLYNFTLFEEPTITYATPAPTVLPPFPSPQPTPTPTPDTQAYISNKRSKKFHLSTYANLPKEENRIYMQNREQAIADGYTPCNNCKA